MWTHYWSTMTTPGGFQCSCGQKIAAADMKSHFEHQRSCPIAAREPLTAEQEQNKWESFHAARREPGRVCWSGD